MLLLAIIVGAAVAAYGLFLDKSGQAIAFATAGLFVLGVALALSGFLLGTSAVSAGRDGRDGRALAIGLRWAACACSRPRGALAGAVVFAVVVLF